MARFEDVQAFLHEVNRDTDREAAETLANEICDLLHHDQEPTAFFGMALAFTAFLNGMSKETQTIMLAAFPLLVGCIADAGELQIDARDGNHRRAAQ